MHHGRKRPTLHLLDNDMRVKSFTPSIADVFHLIESDLGRPLTDIAARIDYPDLREDVRRVLRTLTPVERDHPAVELLETARRHGPTARWRSASSHAARLARALSRA